MLDRIGSADELCRGAQLDQDGEQLVVCRRFVQRATKKVDSRRGRAVFQSTPRSGTKRVAHEAVAGREGSQQMPAGLLGTGAAPEQELSRASMHRRAQPERNGFVDRASHDRMSKLDRVFAAQELEAYERGRGACCVDQVELRERRGVLERRFIPQYRRAFDQRACLRLELREALLNLS